MVKTQCVVNYFVKLFWFGTLSDKKDMAVAGFETISQSAMRRHSVANLAPTHVDALLFQTGSNTVQHMIGQQRDKDVGIASVLFLMEHRAQQQL